LRSIWKFTLRVADEQGVEMPEGAQILTVQNQGEWLILWAKVNPDARAVKRRIWVVGTGHPMPDVFGLAYIGTVQQADGALVWHVFDGGQV
jgi:hypothetical protein